MTWMTAGADVQKDRIEVDVWAWGRGLESWLIEHIVIEGGPERAEPWAELDRLLGQTWRYENGAALALTKLAIDTGYESTAVYGWARRAGVAQVAPVKGADGFNRSSPVSGPTYVDASDGGRRLRRGSKQHARLDAPVDGEDHCLGRRHRGPDGGGETVRQQCPAPIREHPRTQRQALVGITADSHLERAFELEVGIQQIRDHAKAIDPRFAAERQLGEPPLEGARHSGVHRTPPSTTVSGAASSRSVRAPLMSASNGSTAPSATRRQIFVPIGVPPIPSRHQAKAPSGLQSRTKPKYLSSGRIISATACWPV